MNESERNYFLTKLKEECKIFYYKNSMNLNLNSKNVWGVLWGQLAQNSPCPYY